MFVCPEQSRAGILLKTSLNIYPFSTHYNIILHRHDTNKILNICISFFSEASTSFGRTMEIVIDDVNFAAKSLSI